MVMAVDSAENSESGASNLTSVLAVRQALLQSMEKAREIGTTLQKSGEKLRQIEKNRMNLDSVMTPLSARSKESRQLTESVDRALEPASDILRAVQSIRGMESVLMDDPQNNLQRYLDALSDLEQQLNCATGAYPTLVESLKDAIHVAGRSRISDTYGMHKLNEALGCIDIDPGIVMKNGSGLKDLALERLQIGFGTILVENSTPKNLHGEGSEERDESSDMQDSGEVMAKLQAIAERLMRCGRGQKCLKMYWDVRIGNLREGFKSLEPYYLKYNSSATIDKLDWRDLEEHVSEWLVVLKKTVRVLWFSERKLCSTIFESFDSELWTGCFGKLIFGSGMSALIEFGEAFALSHTEPQKLFKLLDLVEGLEGLKEDIEIVFRGSGCLEIRVRLRELHKQLVHSACQVLWDFAKLIEDDNGTSSDGSPPKLTSYVVNYLKFMVTEYGVVMTRALKMENNASLADAVASVLTALEMNLESRAKGYSETALGHIFLMNNYWYIFKRARDSELGSLLSEAWLKQRKRLVNQHVLDYEKAEWGPLLKHLSRDGLATSSGGRGGARDLFKQRLRAFNIAFDKICETHRGWVISDEELREGIYVKIVQAVVPAYRSYIDSFRHLLDQAASGSRHLKYTPDHLENMLADLFAEKPSSRRVPNETRRRTGSDQGPVSV